MTGHEIQTLLEKQKKYDKSAATIPVNFRIVQLKKLYKTIKKTDLMLFPTINLLRTKRHGLICQCAISPIKTNCIKNFCICF